MDNNCQLKYLHILEKDYNCNRERINLTFRTSTGKIIFNKNPQLITQRYISYQPDIQIKTIDETVSHKIIKL